MTTTKLFRTNRSQAVRLPKDVAFPPAVREVTVLRQGTARLIVPTESLWDDFFSGSGIDLERNQPERSREKTPAS